MKKIAFLFLLIHFNVCAQFHTDIFKMSYAETFKNNFKDSLNSTHIYSINTELTIPIKINDKHAIISGIDYSKSHLQLSPNDEFSDLKNTVFKLGMASQWDEKLSSSIVLLPRFSSDKGKLKDEFFFLGLYATVRWMKNENFGWRLGFYGSTEAYGIFTTPIIGWVYKSPDERFEMDMSLPIKGDLSYKFGRVSVGADYYALSRSFKLYPENKPELYSDLNSIRISSYLQLNTFQDKLLLRAKIGYSSDNYEVYDNKEKKLIKLSAFKFGDKRKQLNPDLESSPYFSVEAVYRFHLGSGK